MLRQLVYQEYKDFFFFLQNTYTDSHLKINSKCELEVITTYLHK